MDPWIMCSHGAMAYVHVWLLVCVLALPGDKGLKRFDWLINMHVSPAVFAVIYKTSLPFS